MAVQNQGNRQETRSWRRYSTARSRQPSHIKGYGRRRGAPRRTRAEGRCMPPRQPAGPRLSVHETATGTVSVDRRAAALVPAPGCALFMCVPAQPPSVRRTVRRHRRPARPVFHAGVRQTTTRRGTLRCPRPVASPSRSLDIGNRPSALPDHRTPRSQPLPGASDSPASRHSCREHKNRGAAAFRTMPAAYDGPESGPQPLAQGPKVAHP